MKYLKPIQLYSESFNKRTGPLMGLIVGQKTLGISFSDANKKTVLPPSMSKTVVRTKESVSAVQELIRNHLVSGLVIGYPFRFEERSPTAGREAKSFVDEVNNSNFKHMNYYTLWDESFTTKILAQLIRTKSKSYNPPHNYTHEEEYAAYEMLEEYLYYIINPREHPDGFAMINQNYPLKGSQA